MASIDDVRAFVLQTRRQVTQMKRVTRMPMTKMRHQQQQQQRPQNDRPLTSPNRTLACTQMPYWPHGLNATTQFHRIELHWIKLDPRS